MVSKVAALAPSLGSSFRTSWGGTPRRVEGERQSRKSMNEHRVASERRAAGAEGHRGQEAACIWDQAGSCVKGQGWPPS